ncbi:MAG: hypothetical protein ACK52I_01760 [Pseudomonadota bacterium]
MSALQKFIIAFADDPLRRAQRKLIRREPGAAVTLEDDEIQALIDDVARHPDDSMHARTVVGRVRNGGER